MMSVVFLIEQVAVGLYILCGAGITVSLYRVLRAHSEYRGTYFELERALARNRRADNLSNAIILLELVLIVVGMQRVVAPALRQTIDIPQSVIMQSSDGEFRTPTPIPFGGQLDIDTSGVELQQADQVNIILPTPTLTPTPVGTIVPNTRPAECATPDLVSMQIPANGMIVFQPLTVIGVASAENFAFYRFELRGASTGGNFATLGVDGTQPVTELAPLGQFAPGFYTPGEYQFRVSVFDITGSLQASCTVTIFISEPIPTPTPLVAEVEGAP